MGISQFIKDKAMELGFSACGIAEVAKAGSEEAYFDQWIAEGYHAGMKYMENHREIRLNPDGLVEGAKSVISVRKFSGIRRNLISRIMRMEKIITGS